MIYQTLIIEQEENIGIITLNRPPANAINYTLLDEIDKALTEMEHNKEIRVIIITGAGEKGFSAGFDVKTTGTLEEGKTLSKGHEVFTRIERYSKPIIAAINGFALGGGCELSMACHFRIMVDSENAVIGLPEINLGIIPGWGGTQRLPRLIGKTKALEMLLLGKRIRAPEALNIRLVTKVSQSGALMEDAKELAQNLADKAPIAMKTILDIVTRGLDTTLEEGLKLEQLGAQQVGKTKDAKEGMIAFVQKRKPIFKGE